MSFLNLKEYLDGRGKLVTNPPVSKAADYSGPNPTAPVTSKVHKDAGGSSKSLGKHAPYAPKATKPAAIEKDGLAGKGKTPSPYPEPGEYDAEGKPVKSPWTKKSKNQSPYPASKAKMVKTESFIQKTKDMPIADFMKYMYAECGVNMDSDSDDEDSDLPTVTAYTAGKFHPHPPEAIKYVAALAKANPRIMEMLIHEIKRQDGLGDLMSSTMDHPETYSVLSDLFGDPQDGPGRSKALVNSMDDKYQQFMDDQDGMYEAVAPPFGMSDDDDSDDDDDDQSPDMDSDSDSDDDQARSDDDSDIDPDADSADDSQDDDSSDDNIDPDADPNDDSNVDPSDNPDDSMPPEDDTDQDSAIPVKKKKLKKKFAHHNILNAMKDVGHMRHAMSDTVKDGQDGPPSGMNGTV